MLAQYNTKQLGGVPTMLEQYLIFEVIMTKTGHVIGKVLITSEDAPIPVFQNTVMQKYTIHGTGSRTVYITQTLFGKSFS